MKIININRETLEGIKEALTEAQKTPGVRALVISYLVAPGELVTVVCGAPERVVFLAQALSHRVNCAYFDEQIED